MVVGGIEGDSVCDVGDDVGVCVVKSRGLVDVMFYCSEF